MIVTRERYRQALEKDFAYFKGSNQDLTRLEFLNDHIFGVVTYDSKKGINLWTGALSMTKELIEMEDDCGTGLDFTIEQWHEFIEVLAEFAMNS
jgi:hypothetical protein